MKKVMILWFYNVLGYAKVGREAVHEFLDMERSEHWYLEKRIKDCKIYKGHSAKNMVIYRAEMDFENVTQDELEVHVREIDKRNAWDGMAYDEVKQGPTYPNLDT